MAIFSKRVDEPHSRYVENLRRALDMEEKVTHTPPPSLDPSTDRQLADEFRYYLKQTEWHITRIEGLLRRYSRRVTPQVL
jgi:ferritin-like metal-binding protein YciE